MLESKHVPRKCGPPMGPMFNRPSIEYTGRGNKLVCFGWNCRYFRSDWDDVRKQCDIFTSIANGNPSEGNDGEYVNVGELEQMWGIVPDDAGEHCGWAPSDDYAFPCFVFEVCGKGTGLYDKFGEEVLLVSIPPEAYPYEWYWEV